MKTIYMLINDKMRLLFFGFFLCIAHIYVSRVVITILMSVRIQSKVTLYACTLITNKYRCHNWKTTNSIRCSACLTYFIFRSRFFLGFFILLFDVLQAICTFLFSGLRRFRISGISKN